MAARYSPSSPHHRSSPSLSTSGSFSGGRMQESGSMPGSPTGADRSKTAERKKRLFLSFQYVSADSVLIITGGWKKKKKKTMCLHSRRVISPFADVMFFIFTFLLIFPLNDHFIMYFNIFLPFSQPRRGGISRAMLLKTISLAYILLILISTCSCIQTRPRWIASGVKCTRTLKIPHSLNISSCEQWLE